MQEQHVGGVLLASSRMPKACDNVWAACGTAQSIPQGAVSDSDHVLQKHAFLPAFVFQPSSLLLKTQESLLLERSSAKTDHSDVTSHKAVERCPLI